MAEPAIIDKSVEKAHIWLGEVAEELGIEDRQEAGRGGHAGSRAGPGSPSATPVKYRGLAGFLERIATEAMLDGETEASYASSSVAQVLRRHISPGELDEVRAVLPDELRVILG